MSNLNPFVRSEYVLINFIVRGSFRCITADSEDPISPKRIDQDLVFAPVFWLPKKKNDFCRFPTNLFSSGVSLITGTPAL